MNLVAPHEVRNHGKVLVLAAHMLRDGWQGAPLVTDGEETLLTGTHRLAACRLLDQAGYSEFRDAAIPTIDIRDIFCEADLWTADDEPMDFAYFVGESYDMGDLIWAVSQLPAALRAEYGLDMH